MLKVLMMEHIKKRNQGKSMIEVIIIMVVKTRHMSISIMQQRFHQDTVRGVGSF
jgi:hypothetical protein